MRRLKSQHNLRRHPLESPDLELRTTFDTNPSHVLFFSNHYVVGSATKFIGISSLEPGVVTACRYASYLTSTLRAAMPGMENPYRSSLPFPMRPRKIAVVRRDVQALRKLAGVSSRYWGNGRRRPGQG